MEEPYRVARPRASGPPRGANAVEAISEALRPKAVFVAHGMGQQVPFETMDTVAQGLCKEIEGSGARVESRTARTVRIGCETLQRLELDVRTMDGEKLRPIHLYEAYWAPLTEGAVGLAQVVRFLLSGAWNGLRSNARLHRFMFGKARQFHISRWSLALLAAVVITLIAMLIIGGTIPAAAIARWILPGNGFVNGQVITDLTALFELLLGVIAGAAAFAVVVSAIGRSIRNRLGWMISALTVIPVTAIVLAVWVSAYLAIPAILAFDDKPLFDARPCDWCPHSLEGLSGWLQKVASVVGDLARWVMEVVRHCGWAERAAWWFLLGSGIVIFGYALLAVFSKNGAPRKKGGRVTGVALALLAIGGILAICGNGVALAYVTWLLLFAVILFVRFFLVEYIGDVAIYVSPHVVDRFFDLRIRIRGVVRRAARAVYACRDDNGGFLYDGVVVVGHSLGSVVVYDVLNRLINEDMLSTTPPATCDGELMEDLQVCDRTKLLLTFGSPLDKTAFVFAQHKLEAGSERDALAASVQPLITAERKFRWINLWTPFDILGGHLDFYDTPKRPGEPQPNKKRVRNLFDQRAITPFAAHSEFWHNQLLYRMMYRALR